MKEAFEEYGGALVAGVLAAAIILLIFGLLDGDSGGTGNTIRDLIIQFFTSIGGSQT